MPQSIPYLPNIIAALASGAVGAGLSRTMTRRLPNEDDDQYQKRLSLNTGIGALGGAATGAALPTIAGLLPGGEDKNPLHWIPDGAGAIADGVTNLASPLGVAGAAVGGYFGGQKAEKRHEAATTALQSKADSIRGTYNAAINDPAMRATHGAELSSAEAAVKASRANGGKVKWTGRSTGGLYGLGGGFLADKLLSGYLQ